jgi:hypothetical protein
VACAVAIDRQPMSQSNTVDEEIGVGGCEGSMSDVETENWGGEENYCQTHHRLPFFFFASRLRWAKKNEQSGPPLSGGKYFCSRNTRVPPRYIFPNGSLRPRMNYFFYFFFPSALCTGGRFLRRQRT